MKIFSRAFATVDILVAIALVAGLIGITASYLNNNFTVDAGTVASCSQESALLSDAIACTRAQQAGGGGTTCADVDNCVSNSASMATKWPDLTTDGAGNLSIGTGTGANNVADNEVTCAGAPASLTLNCTDDTFGAGGNTCTPVTEICGNNIDDDCDGLIDAADTADCSLASTGCPCADELATTYGLTVADLFSLTSLAPSYYCHGMSSHERIVGSDTGEPIFLGVSPNDGFCRIADPAFAFSGNVNGVDIWIHALTGTEMNSCTSIIRTLGAGMPLFITGRFGCDGR